MRRYWQRRPLLIREAFANFVAPIGRDDLFALAASDDVESRVVRLSRGRWSLRHGPFEFATLPLVQRHGWTLLVQGVDLHRDDAHELLARFRFVPDARLDDLMASYAVDGGGVGAHVDSYDVFLLQAQGLRRWRIAPPGRHPLIAGAPLELLERFDPSDEFLLGPGDMLYLPPGWAHEGTAIGECVTYSVGFRAPSRHALLGAWFTDRGDAAIRGPDTRYRDPGAARAAAPAAIPASLHDRLAAWIRNWRPTVAEVDGFVGRFLTEPKSGVWFQRPRQRLSAAQFARRCAETGLRVDRRTRLAYRRGSVFVNGEAAVLDAGVRRTILRLCNARSLPPDALAQTPVDSQLLGLLREWFDAGWIVFDERR